MVGADTIIHVKMLLLYAVGKEQSCSSLSFTHTHVSILYKKWRLIQTGDFIR